MSALSGEQTLEAHLLVHLQRTAASSAEQTFNYSYRAALQRTAASSIRLGQVLFGSHSLSALTKAFASSMSFRIMAVRATFLGLP